MKNTIISRFAIVSGLLVFNTLGFATVARAGEGGVAGAAAFTVTADKITGVAVSSAIGKENASAAAFNYEVTASSNQLQNAAWSQGTAGVQVISNVGKVDGFTSTPAEETDPTRAQGNSFTDSFSVKLGTTSGDSVADIDGNPVNP